MYHSITELGEEIELLSELRKQKPSFTSKSFIQYALENKDKYEVSRIANQYKVKSETADKLVKEYKQWFKELNNVPQNVKSS